MTTSREKIAEYEFGLVLRLAHEHGFKMSALTWEELEPKFREYYYYRAVKILAFISKDKPPLLEQKNCHEVNNPSDWNMGASEQRDADIRHYEGK